MIFFKRQKDQVLAIRQLFGNGGQMPFLPDNDYIWEYYDSKGITLTDIRSNNMCKITYIKLLKEIEKVMGN